MGWYLIGVQQMRDSCQIVAVLVFARVKYRMACFAGCWFCWVLCSCQVVAVQLGLRCEEVDVREGRIGCFFLGCVGEAPIKILLILFAFYCVNYPVFMANISLRNFVIFSYSQKSNKYNPNPYPLNMAKFRGICSVFSARDI